MLKKIIKRKVRVMVNSSNSRLCYQVRAVHQWAQHTCAICNKQSDSLGIAKVFKQPKGYLKRSLVLFFLPRLCNIERGEVISLAWTHLHNDSQTICPLLRCVAIGHMWISSSQMWRVPLWNHRNMKATEIILVLRNKAVLIVLWHYCQQWDNTHCSSLLYLMHA